jgi:hypothetical protein
MKIERKRILSPFATIQIWLIPTVFYSAQKLAGIKHNDLEWIWWVLIPFMFSIWFFINWKIKKNS